MATQTTEVAWPPLDSQASQSLVDEFVPAADQTGDLQTDFKKALIAKLGLIGQGYSLDDLWHRYLIEVVPSDAESVGPAKRSPPEHAGQHPKHYLPPGRLRNPGNAKGFPFGTTSGYPYDNGTLHYGNGSIAFFRDPAGAADLRFCDASAAQYHFARPLLATLKHQYPAGTKSYMEFYFHDVEQYFNTGSSPFIHFTLVDIGSQGYNFSTGVCIQPRYNATQGAIRYGADPLNTMDLFSSSIGTGLDPTPFTVNVALDYDSQKVWFGINGSWKGAGTQNPETGEGGYWPDDFDQAQPTGNTTQERQFGVYCTYGSATTADRANDYSLRLSEDYWQYTAPTGYGAWPKIESQVADVSSDPQKQEWVPHYYAGAFDEYRYCQEPTFSPWTGATHIHVKQITSYMTRYNFNRRFTTGKYYAEFTMTDGYQSSGFYFGLIPSATYNMDRITVPGSVADGATGFYAGGAFYSNGSINPSPYTSGLYLQAVDARTANAWAVGDTLMLAVDWDNMKWYMGLNGTWFESQDPTNASHGLTIPTGCDALTLNPRDSSCGFYMNTGGGPWRFTPPTAYEAFSNGGTFIQESGTITERGSLTYVVDTIGASPTGTLSIDKPTGVVEGDLVMLYVWGSEASPSLANPSGGSSWTQTSLYGQVASGDTQIAYFYYKIAGASEPAQYTLTNTGYPGGGEVHAACFAMTNAYPENLDSNWRMITAISNLRDELPGTSQHFSRTPGSLAYYFLNIHTGNGYGTASVASLNNDITLLHQIDGPAGSFYIAKQTHPVDQTGTYMYGGQWVVPGFDGLAFYDVVAGGQLFKPYPYTDI